MKKVSMKILNALLIAASLLSTQSMAVDDDMDIGVLKVGAIFPFTGSQRLYGQEAYAGMELAYEKFIEDNPQFAKKIVIIKSDDKSRPSEAGDAAEKLIKTKRVNILFGSITNSSSFEIAKVANRLKKPMIIPVSTKPGITNLGEYIFRSASIDPFQGKILSLFATNNLKAKTAAIITNQESDFSNQIGSQFEKSFTALGGQISDKVKYDPEKKQHMSVLKKVLAKKPDVLVIPSRSEESSQFLKLIKKMNYKIPVLGSDGWDFRTLSKLAGKKALKGHFYSSQFSTISNITSTQDFVGRFKKKMRRYPSQLAALTYDGFMLVCEAYKKAKSIRSKPLSRAIQRVGIIHGVTGDFAINSERNAEKTYVILKTGEEKISFESIISPINKQ